MNNTLPELPKSLADFCELRNKALAQIKIAETALKNAEHHCGEAGPHILPHELVYTDFDRHRRDMDARFWQAALNLTNFKQIMDAQALREFHDTLQTDKAPPFTVENVREVFLSVAVNRNEIMVRGIVNVFEKLDPEYRRNDAFKVASSIVMRGMFQWGFSRLTFSTWRHGADRLCDIDRIFKTLDGKKYEQRSLEFAIEAELKQQRGPFVYEDEYFKVKGFKNGNAHVTFKRADLLDKVNELIADWYGPRTLSARRTAA